MSNTLRTFNNVNNIFIDSRHEELWFDKLEREHWSNINKRYLLRVYKPLMEAITYLQRPKWGDVVEMMLGYKHKGYYSTVYKSLKEIGVIRYSPLQKCIVPGPNWVRFYGVENWDWFYMNTSSGMLSYETQTTTGESVRKVYQSNYKK